MILYDSTSAADIPITAEAVAGYIDGIYITWTPEEWVRFAGSRRLTIAISAAHDADILDIETYDATPDQAAGWVKRQKSRFIWVYCNRRDRPAVENNLHSNGITSDQVGLWIATLDGTQVVPASPFGYQVCAVQYANSQIAGGHFDESIVYGRLPGEIEDLTPDQDAMLKITTYSILGPPPAKVLAYMNGQPPHGLADVINLYNTSNQQDLINSFTIEGYTWMQRLAEPWTVGKLLIGTTIEPLETEPTKFTGTIQGTLS